jgi:D-lactate dehydrogenase
MAERRASAPALDIRGLNVFYGASHALQGVDLHLHGGVLSVVGRNGMGKTTLCKAIMGLVPVASGSISFAGTSLVGLSPADIARLWTARKSLSHAVKKIAPLKINEDVVVPVSRLAELVGAIDALAATWRLPIVSFGHAGNGNLHVNLMVHPDDADEMARAGACHDALIETVLGLGGSLSGEHGIGSEKRRYVARELDAETLALMRDLKRWFDPNGILNPGKKLPDPS